jgi:hypothetical protein
MNVNYKKSLKFLTLLVSALLIGTVSAATYYTMLMHSHDIGVDTGNKVYFTTGGDWPAGSSMGDGNQTVTLTGLKGGNGTIAEIPDPLRIYNNDIVPHSLNLKLDAWNGNSQNQLNYINVTLYNAVPSGGTAQGQIIYLLPGGSGQVTETGAVTINSGSTWRVQWTIYWKSTATAETVNVDLKLEVS